MMLSRPHLATSPFLTPKLTNFHKVMSDSMQKIGIIGNYYGGLFVRTENGKYYWSIEDWDGHGWDEIPRFLYDSLREYDRCRLINLLNKQNSEHEAS
jgi:hypothetical protein